MRRFTVILLLWACLAACTDNRRTHQELVTEYYSAFNAADFERLSTLIADSITIIEGEFVSPYDVESFYEQFKWDSVFQPTYEIVDLVEQGDQIIATVSSSSVRYKFLKNDPLTTVYKISFKADDITKLEVIDYVEPDWNTWQQERDTLVKWIQENHPELDGFIYDLSMEGALN